MMIVTVKECHSKISTHRLGRSRKATDPGIDSLSPVVEAVGTRTINTTAEVMPFSALIV
jgi:hypothetical protein